MQTSGSAGPSGRDAHAWRHLCTVFGNASNDLCAAISAFAHRTSTSYVNSKYLSAYCACRLIPLDKRPGVRPIGVSEVLRRIIEKAVMRIIGMIYSWLQDPLNYVLIKWEVVKLLSMQ